MLDLPAETKEKLKFYIQRAESNFYGELVPWETVKELFPKNTNAQITDLETGFSFQVQRRAGSQHADVQPLTREDSRTMKKIYNGKWSWKRRAILVKVGNRSIAASMNGMPHGAGAIKGNEFPGHFCIHFEGSTTHRLRKRDPGHYLMIRKASGRLNQEIVQSSPEQLVDLFLAAIKAQDLHAAGLMLDHTNLKAIGEFIYNAREIEDIRVIKNYKGHVEEDPSNVSQMVKIPVKVSIRTASSGKERKKELTIVVKRSSMSDRWKIDVNSVSPLVGPTDKRQPEPDKQAMAAYKIISASTIAKREDGGTGHSVHKPVYGIYYQNLWIYYTYISKIRYMKSCQLLL